MKDAIMTTATKPIVEPKASPGKRIYNFSAGPAVLPEEVIHQAQQDIWNIFDTGIGDLMLQGKWRIHQHDFGPIDTSRFSIIAGLEIPTFDNHFSTEGVNPIIGGVYTHVQGRHGFNIAAQYKFNTGSGTQFNLGGGLGSADALFYDASYLYRLSPAEYTPDTLGAWYALIELNGIYETNGDNEISLTPGIMYEARTWTIEAGVRIPVWQDLDRRPETRFEVIAGLRLLF
jgi:hypothetical protein